MSAPPSWLTTLFENKILLGKPLQPIQASLLLVSEDYLETSFEDNELLTENQRKKSAARRYHRRSNFHADTYGRSGRRLVLQCLDFSADQPTPRVEMLGKAEYLSLKYHSETRTGDAVYRVYQDRPQSLGNLEFIISFPLRFSLRSSWPLKILTFFSPWLGFFNYRSGSPHHLLFKYFIPKVRQAAERARKKQQ
ncbi:MAG: hypothetical protein Ct9H90mP27_4900 [Gammaproteobacteria bacterium]|nr:MAG: hypothetical protein Ct9H90mP27_4900 [Gammaproteobacteria bacterium]